MLAEEFPKQSSQKMKFWFRFNGYWQKGCKKRQIVKPAWLNRRSDGADVAGMHNMWRADIAKYGYVISLIFHHASGLVHLLCPWLLFSLSIMAISGSCLYFTISAATAASMLSTLGSPLPFWPMLLTTSWSWTPPLSKAWNKLSSSASNTMGCSAAWTLFAGLSLCAGWTGTTSGTTAACFCASRVAVV